MTFFSVYLVHYAVPSLANVMFCEFAKPIVIKYYSYYIGKPVREVVLIVQSTRLGRVQK